jgi:hypothetical protein
MDTTIITSQVTGSKVAKQPADKVEYECFEIVLCDLCHGYAGQHGCACVRCMGNGFIRRRVGTFPTPAAAVADVLSRRDSGRDEYDELQRDAEAIALDEWAALPEADRAAAEAEADEAWQAAEDEARRSWKVA